MKKLIVVRHGSYEAEVLSAFGRKEMSQLSEKLKVHIQDQSFSVLVSPVRRAVQSAEILCATLGGGFEKHSCLAAHDDYMPSPDKVVELVQASVSDVVILVTHMPYGDLFPRYYCKTVLGADVRTKNIQTGDAVVLDCDTLTSEVVRGF